MASDQHEELISWTVGGEDAGGRLDQIIAQKLRDRQISRSEVVRLIERGVVLVNGSSKKAKTTLKLGDQVSVGLTAPKSKRLVPTRIDLTILYEDDHIAVVDKPAGLAVHPGAGESKTTLAHALLMHTEGKLARQDDDDERPGIVHRLDKDTSGVLVVAKTNEAHAHLSAQFKAKTNTREYVALCDGIFKKDSVIIENYLGRDPKNRTMFRSKSLDDFGVDLRTEPDWKPPKGWRYAKSVFTREKIFLKQFSLVTVQLMTGRTHQIRVHARDLGLPVLGDKVYGRTLQIPKNCPEEAKSILKGISRQLLHAKTLGFTHPKTLAPMAFTAEIPQDFRQVLEILERS